MESKSKNVHVLYGEDDFSKKEFLDDLLQNVGPPEVLEANITTLAGAGLTRNQLQDVCNVVPFLAEQRLVVVEGLLRQFDEARGDRRRSRAARARNDGLQEWQGLAETFSSLPPTTTLVFLEGSLRRDNPLLHDLASSSQVHEFRVPGGEVLERWIRDRVAGAGATITSGAVRQLVTLVGGNLWALSGEIEKLGLYADGDPIDEKGVVELVANTREASIFRAVDAVLAGRSASALQLVNTLRQGGAEVSYIITMLARQLRLILLAQELLPQRLPRPELGRRLGLTAEFAVRATEEQARSHLPDQVAAMYRKLMETDLAIKRGELGEQLALEVLVAELPQSARPYRALSSELNLPHPDLPH